MRQRGHPILLALFLALTMLITGCSREPGGSAPVPTVTPTARPSLMPTSAPFTVTEPPPAQDLPTTTPTKKAPSATSTIEATEPSPEPSPTPTTAPTTAPRSIQEAVTVLQNLPIDVFFEASYRQLLRRSPERLTALGMSAEFGLRDDQLDDLSDAYLRDTQSLEHSVLDLLREYDRAELTPEQATSYAVYEWYLDSEVRGHEFAYHTYPLNGFLNSYEFSLDLLLTEYHPLQTVENASDYVARLWQVDDQVDQLFEGLRIRSELGIIPPDYVISAARHSLLQALGVGSPDPAAVNVETVRLYDHFAAHVAAIDALSPADEQALLKDARLAIVESMVPAYIRLIDHLDLLKAIATHDAGVWRLPDGDRYYSYLLHRETSTDLTPAEIHQLGLDEVARIESEMRAELVAMGYPSEGNLPDLMTLMMNDAGYYTISTPAGRDAYITDIETLIAGAEEAVKPVFDLRPQWGVTVIAGPSGGYYVAGAADGSRPGSYHVNLDGSVRPRYQTPSVAFHETVPGHHYQIAVAQALDLPLFRTDLVFNAYAEGWALYAERLAWELGLYANDPYGNLGRLQWELLRAVRLVVDTGLHAMRWTREEGSAYMAAHLMPWMDEVDRYTVMPAQATGYKIGMIEMLRLRREAVDRLGDQFDLRSFHDVILGHGSMPLPILERVVLDWLDTRGLDGP